jgi:hypothetical protein
VHNSFIKCTKYAKKAFPFKIFFSRTKRGVEKLNKFWKAKEVLYVVSEQHLLAAYTFAAAASRLLSYKQFEF